MKKSIQIDLTRLDWGRLETRATFLMITPEELVTKLVMTFLHEHEKTGEQF